MKVLRKESAMRKFLQRIEVQMMAIAFAEAGEHETARQFLTDRSRSSKLNPSLTDAAQKRPRPNMQA